MMLWGSDREEYEALKREQEYEAKREREKEAIDGLAIMLGISQKCRENCPYFYETAESFFIEGKGQISTYQMEYLKLQCTCCKGKETGEIDPVTEKRCDKSWDEIVDWVKMYEMNPMHCPHCKNVYEVYGNYKDPDDEWKAIEDLCEYCKYWGAEE